MNDSVVVSNSSPIIALNQIQHLFILEKLFCRVQIPPAVASEICSGLEPWPEWIVTTGPCRSVDATVLALTLGPGESEAISLALSLNAQWICLDDRPARRTAEALGLKVIGTLGLLLASKRKGIIPAIRPPIERMVSLGFRASPDLLLSVFADAGEQ